MYYHLYKDCYKAWSTYISVGPARGVVGDSDQVFPVLQGPGLDGGADVGIGVGGGLGEHGAGVAIVYQRIGAALVVGKLGKIRKDVERIQVDVK